MKTDVIRRRVAVSAGVGGGLAVLWALLAVALTHGVVCGDGFGCLWIIFVLLPALAVLAVLAWPILAFSRVEPAWSVALLGPLVAFALTRVTPYFSGLGPNAEVIGYVLLVLLVAAGYALAAFVSAPETPSRWRAVVAVPLALIVLWSLIRYF